MTTPKPRIGVLGAGSISDYHISGLRAAGAEVTALFGRTAAKTQAQADKYGISHVFTDPHALLAQPDVDAVVIATPDFTHVDMALAAVAARKPMLLQKPMARTSAECQQIIAAAHAAGAPLYVGFMHRYFSEIETLQRLLAEAALGQLTLVRQRNATGGADWADWFYRKELVGGGAVMQIGIHGIDLLQHVFGPIVAVRAATAITVPQRTLADGRIITPDNEDLALATYRFASGLLATHEVSYTEVVGTDRFRMEVYGDRGTAWLRTERGLLAVSHDRRSWVTPDLPPGDVGYRQHRHWLAMLAGAAPHDGSDAAGLASVQVAEALYRSAEAAAWMPVQDRA
jgi:predicted dehydrogenase